jgi:hypothetical protein
MFCIKKMPARLGRTGIFSASIRDKFDRKASIPKLFCRSLGSSLGKNRLTTGLPQGKSSAE